MNPFSKLLESVRSFFVTKDPESTAPAIFGADMTEIYPGAKESEYLNWFKSWAYICISAIAESMGEIKLNLNKVKSGGETEVIQEHEVLSLLEHPNDILGLTQYTLFELTQIYLELTGEAFWLVNKVGTRPLNIWILRPDCITITINKSGEITGYKHRSGAESTTFEPDEIIHFKYPNPLSPLRGKSTVEAADLTLEKDREAERYNWHFFKNSALPRGILTYDSEARLDDAAKERIKTEWDKNYQGISKSHQVALMLGGLKWQDIGISQKDMDFINAARFDRDKILSMFRVPKPVVAISDDVNLANAKVGDFVFKKHTMKPKMRRMTDTLNVGLLSMFKDSSLFFTFDSPVPEDIKTKAETAKIGITSGFITPNEARHMIDLPFSEDENANKLYAPINLQPIAAVEKPKLRSPQAPKEKLSTLFIRKMVRKSLKELNVDIKRIKKATKKDEVHRIVGEIRWKQMIERLDDHEKEFREKIRQQFKRQEAEVLRRLAGGLIVRSKEINRRSKFKLADIFDIIRENKLLVALATPIITKILKQEYDEARRFVSGSEALGISEQLIQNFLDENITKFARTVNKTIRHSLGIAIKDGIAEGESVTKISQRISDIYTGYQGKKSLQIARTEVIRTSNYSAVEAYRDAGYQAKQWLTAADERTCQYCMPMDGQVIKIKDNFFKKGDEFTGIEGGKLDLGYSDTPFPPLHPSCRCTIIPVFSKGMKVTGKNLIEEMKQEVIDKAVEEAKKKIEEAGIKTLSKFTELHQEIKKITGGKSKKEMYNCECLDCGYTFETDKHCVDIKCPKCGGTCRRVERPGAGRAAEEIKPYKVEHACRLEDPGKYDRFARKNCAAKHDGKCIDHVYGIKAGKSELQSMRYKKKIWTKESARNHCKGEDGTFEPAKEE